MTAIEEREDVETGEDTRERVVVWDTKEVLYVHPVASLFRMLSDEELEDLARDIRQNGQAEPIVLDQHRQLIDGRNRLAACNLARISPDVISVTLEDPVAYILSRNVARRHDNKGQLAMSVIQARLFTSKKFAFGQAQEVARQFGLSGARLSQAVAVGTHTPELVAEVASGRLSLTDAYRAAQEAKRLKGEAGDAAQRRDAAMEDLRARAADLADLVEDDRLSLEDAQAAVEQRWERERQKRKAALELLFRGIGVFDPAGETPDARAAGLALGPEMMSLPDGSRIAVLPDGSRLTEERLRGCVDVVRALYAQLYEGMDDGQAPE